MMMKTGITSMPYMKPIGGLTAFIDMTLSPPGGVDIAIDIYHAQEGTMDLSFGNRDERGSVVLKPTIMVVNCVFR